VERTNRIANRRAALRTGAVTGLALLAAAGVALVVTALRADAASCDKNWVGPPGGLYQTGANWSPTGVPSASQFACAPPGSSIVFSDTQNRTVKGVDFKGSLTITGTRELRIGTTSANEASSVANLVLNGRRGGAAQLTVTGSLTVGSGAILGSPQAATAGYGGTTVVAAGASASLAADLTIESGHTLRNEGSTSWPAGDITLCRASSIVNAGSFELPTSPLYTVSECDEGDGDVAFVNESSGVATKGPGPDEGSLYVPFANDGAVAVQGGSLFLVDQPVLDPDTGSFQISSGATLELCGNRAFGTGAAIGGGGLLRVSCGYIELGPIDTLPVLDFAGGEIVGSLTVTDSFTWGFGLFSGPGTTTIGPSATATGGYYLDGHTLVNEGSWSLGTGELSICAGSTVENRGSLELGPAGGSISNCGDPSGVLLNAAPGTITKGSGGTTQIQPVVTNLGTIEIASGGQLRISGDLTNLTAGTLTGGTYHVAGTLRLDEAGTGGITANGATIRLDGSAATMTNATAGDALAGLSTNAAAGTLQVSGGRQQAVAAGLTNAGALVIDAGSRLTVPGGDLVQTGGSTTLTGSTAQLRLVGGGTVRVDGGTLTGSGTVDATLVRNAARVEPGVSGPGVLDLTGGFTQAASGTLAVDLDGTAPGTQYDVLSAAGPVELAGTLELDGGHAPADGDTYEIATGSSRQGTFDSITGDDAGGGLTFVPVYDTAAVRVLATAAPVLGIDDVAQAEGDAGTSVMTFTLSLSKPSASTVTVQVDTADATATTSDDDYLPQSTLVSFSPSETTATVEVTIVGDTAYEHDETFHVELSGPTNAVIGDPGAVGTILNDDPVPSLSIDDVTVVEGDSGTVPAVFTVSLSAPSPDPVTVGFATADGSATAPSDYDSAAGTLTFQPGDTTRTVTVQVAGDQLYEGDESFVVGLLAPTGATIADGQGTGTIVDDEDQPAVSILDTAVLEGDTGTTDAVFTLTLTPASQSPVTVELATVDGTAVAPEDYTSVSSSVTFDPGETVRTVVVAVNGDTAYELDETFTVELSNPSGATIGDGQASGTILNDDDPPTLSIDDVSVLEGDSGTTDATFTISLSFPSPGPVTVQVATADASAVAPEDYVSVSSSVTFDPGETVRTVAVAVNGDTVYEPDETFTVELSNSSGATIADGQGIGTILNDDEALPSLSIDDVTVVEGDSGTTDAVFTVTLSTASAGTVSVDFATSDGTAVAPGDYLPASGTLTFDPGDTSKTITVTVNGDVVSEFDETFTVVLSNPSGATIADGQATGTILNDDLAPVTVSVGDASVWEGDTATRTILVPVTLSGPSTTPVTVQYRLVGLSATGGRVDFEDFGGAVRTLTIKPKPTTGLTPVSTKIPVKVYGDTVVEDVELVSVELVGAMGAALGRAGGIAVIFDDDPGTGSRVAVSSVRAVEGDTGVVKVQFRVTLSAPATEQTTVVATVVDGTARAGVDYKPAKPKTITFRPGQWQKTITITLLPDDLPEGDRDLAVVLSDPTGATIQGDGVGVAIILDDD
jgi:hypothetical protein